MLPFLRPQDMGFTHRQRERCLPFRDSRSLCLFCLSERQRLPGQKTCDILEHPLDGSREEFV